MFQTKASKMIQEAHYAHRAGVPSIPFSEPDVLGSARNFPRLLGGTQATKNREISTVRFYL